MGVRPRIAPQLSGKLRFPQFIAHLTPGDAVSEDCLQLKHTLEAWGFRSEIYADGADGRLRHLARSVAEYTPKEGDLILLHYSLWSAAAQRLASLDECRLIMIYHNITPWEYFQGSNPHAEAMTRRGREELSRFVPKTILALGASEYSQEELEANGFRSTGVLPYIVDFQELDNPPRQRELEAFQDGKLNLLFVGRVAPNKHHDDLIKVLYHYKRRIDPRVRLILVGPLDTAPAYRDWLFRLVCHLDLEDDVFFIGHRERRQLAGYFRIAQVYLCMSEHEGFCVPLLESMYLGVPVIAYASTAVPYTMGQAGILLKKKNPALVAELIHLLVTEEDLRSRLVAKGRERVENFRRERVEALLAAYIEEAVRLWSGQG